MEFVVKKLSCLEKVFLDKEPADCEQDYRTVFQNEVYSFQAAYFTPEPLTMTDCLVRVEVESEIADHVTLYRVGTVPVEFATYNSIDDEDYLRKTPGLFPDPLFPLEGKFFLIGQQWRSVWAEVDPAGLKAGNYMVKLMFKKEDGELLGEVSTSVEVLNGFLPEQETVFTQWFHYDGLCNYYHLPSMSEEHLETIWRFVDTAVEHGVNMLMIPLFTPALDTLPGGERTTVQLIDVTCEGEGYRFDFERLHSFLETAKAHGIRYYEMSPLFTQWGARFAPKVMGWKNGQYQQLFGWNDKADGKEYGGFLKALLPLLGSKLKEWGVAEDCYFHISDEPQSEEAFANYRNTYHLLHDNLPDFKIMDALSSAEFYQEGYVQYPVASTDSYASFQAVDAKNLWAYYCCGQYDKSPNHFIAMPLRRARILGTQLYRQAASGFLQWGYNFWNSKYSMEQINPYCVTDAGCAFPAGDPFVVYPGEEGVPVVSIRLKALRQAFYDNRALFMLEKLTSRDFVTALIDQQGEVTFMEYPRNDSYLVTLREQVNTEIARIVNAL